jgi:hypothetical protein
MSLAVNDGGVLTRSFEIVTGEPFEVVTLLDPGGHEATAAEWVQTELTQLNPGIFKLITIKICNTCDWPALNYMGEYTEGLGPCIQPTDQFVMLRISYGDYTGVSGDDLVLTIRGFGPGDSQPSSFAGSPGFVDCEDTKFPTVMSGGDAWQTGSGVMIPSGALVLNPTPPLVVGGTPRALSHIKAVYR